MKSGGVGVVPSQIPLINRLRVMIDCAVVTSVIPFKGEALWQDEHLRQLNHSASVVQQAQRLVMNVFVEVALLFEKIQYIGSIIPHRPVVLGKKDINVFGEKLYSLI